MYTGTVDLGLDMFTNGDDVPDGLKHRGFVLDCLEFDVKHMLGASADNWAEIDQIEFYDVDDTAANATPKATFTGQELKQNYVTNGILTIKREDIFKQSNETAAKSWQIRRVVWIWLSDMDDQMTENSVQIGSDGTTTTLDKHFCDLIGHSNVYEQDLELKNSFTAETTGTGTVKYVYKGEDLGLDGTEMFLE